MTAGWVWGFLWEDDENDLKLPRGDGCAIL